MEGWREKKRGKGCMTRGGGNEASSSSSSFFLLGTVTQPPGPCLCLSCTFQTSGLIAPQEIALEVHEPACQRGRREQEVSQEETEKKRKS